MTDHTARPESWEALTQWAASRTDSPAADCILELRTRVERLEQAQHAQPAGGLVEPEITGRELTRIWNDNEDPNEDAGDAMARLYTAGFHAGMKWQAEMMEQAQQQGNSSASLTSSAPEPEPEDDEPLHIVALRMVDTLANLDVLPEITNTIRRAIREPMAEPAEPTDRMDTTLGELLRLNELWNAGEPGGRQLNLSGLDLRGADLSGTDLQDADLSNAFMRCANLTRANLRSANLHGARTRGAIGLPKPAPVEPAPSTPAGQGELFDSVAAVMSESPTDVILAVVKWLESQAWRGAADALRREVGR
jgi:hypothetical protein